MARTDPQLNTRIPVELKARLEASAQDSKRSLNAEVIALLEEALDARVRKAEHIIPQQNSHESNANEWTSLKIEKLAATITCKISAEMNERLSRLEEELRKKPVSLSELLPASPPSLELKDKNPG